MPDKRVCFITLGNLYLCPYILKYTSLLDCDYDVVYWDRHGIKENIGAKQTFDFHYNMEEGSGKLCKAIGYLKFRNYARKVIKSNQYDGIVLLQTSIGLLLQTFLKRRYKGKYIIDIRDYTMENNPLFFALEKSLIKNCAYAVISSRGYQSFLPDYEYIAVHNDTQIDETIIKKFENRKRNKDKIIISYIGLIRFHEQNKKTILKFKNDNRFTLRFIGTDAYALREFCQHNKVNNVELIDRFPPEKTLDYYYETDIIYNLYGSNTPLLDYALSNKLYYAAKLKIPILVCPNTYMEHISKEYGFGYTFDMDNPKACDILFDYYKDINWDKFKNNCEQFIKKVEGDNKVFDKMIPTFIEKI